MMIHQYIFAPEGYVLTTGSQPERIRSVKFLSPSGEVVLDIDSSDVIPPQTKLEMYGHAIIETESDG